MDISYIGGHQRFLFAEEFISSLALVVKRLDIANFQEGNPEFDDPAMFPVTEAQKIQSALATACAAQFESMQLPETENKHEKMMLRTGERIYQQLHIRKSVAVICDTAACLGLYLLHKCQKRHGHVEVINDKSAHHTYLLVNRNLLNRLQACATWGEQAFIVDIWRAVSLMTEQQELSAQNIARKSVFRVTSKLHVNPDSSEQLSLAAFLKFSQPEPSRNHQQ